MVEVGRRDEVARGVTEVYWDNRGAAGPSRWAEKDREAIERQDGENVFPGLQRTAQ